MTQDTVVLESIGKIEMDGWLVGQFKACERYRANEERTILSWSEETIHPCMERDPPVGHSVDNIPDAYAACVGCNHFYMNKLPGSN